MSPELLHELNLMAERTAKEAGVPIEYMLSEQALKLMKEGSFLVDRNSKFEKLPPVNIDELDGLVDAANKVKMKMELLVSALKDSSLKMNKEEQKAFLDQPLKYAISSFNQLINHSNWSLFYKNK